MTVIRRIEPASAFKIGFVINGFFGLILGAFCTLASVAGVVFVRNLHTSMGIAHTVGVAAIVICPLIYGLVGGISAAIGSALYNVASSWLGGLKLELG